jgi:hypothetical protein
MPLLIEVDERMRGASEHHMHVLQQKNLKGITNLRYMVMLKNVLLALNLDHQVSCSF